MAECPGPVAKLLAAIAEIEQRHLVARPNLHGPGQVYCGGGVVLTPAVNEAKHEMNVEGVRLGPHHVMQPALGRREIRRH